MKKILVAIPVQEAHKERLQAAADRAAAAGKEAAELLYKSGASVTAEDLAGVSAVIGNLSPALLRKATEVPGCSLEWVQLNSAGADAYAPADVLAPSVNLTCSKGAYSTSVGEHMLAMTFTLLRRFEQYGRNQVKHVWETAGHVKSVKGSTVLVLGLGDIGGYYAEKMKALGAYVIGVRRTLRSETPAWLDEQHTLGELDDLLPRADIVAMVLPGGDATEHVIGMRQLRKMKDDAILLNDGRGGAVDPDALKTVLAEGKLFGVGLDVTEPEPLPADDPLWDCDRVMITPHIAGQFLLAETFEHIVDIAAENLEAYLTGAPLTHVVNRKFGY